MGKSFVIVSQVLLVLLFAGPARSEGLKAVGPAVFRKATVRADQHRVPPSARGSMPGAAKIALPRLASEDLDKLPARTGLEPMGVHRSLSSERTTQIEGAWAGSADGTRVWRVTIESEGAVGVRLHFTDFAVGDGRVWVHGGDKEDATVRSYSGRGPWNDGDFWSSVIFSDAVTVEFEPGPGAAGLDTVPFQIREISHLWRAAERADDTVEPLAAAAPCQLDATCFPGWAETSRAVALIVFESGGGSFTCSGTLLNTRNQSFTPYFLTAAHCVDDASVARTVEAFWFFESATCNGAPPRTSQVPSVLGARQVRRFGDFNDPRGDFNLLVLEDVPDGVVFSGWDPNPIAFGTGVVGLHHPAGDYKRIMLGEAVQDRFYGTSDSYLIVEETQGRTESGSSGSGLFTAPNVLVGALSFGPRVRRGITVCDINPSYTGYSRFSAFYPEVREYLEDASPPPLDDRVTLDAGVPRDFSLPAMPRATFFDDPIYQVTAPVNSERLTIDLSTLTAGVDVDLYVRRGQAPELQGGEVVADYRSESPNGTEQVVIDGTSTPALQGGNYFVGFVVWTRGAAIDARVTATVDVGASAPAGIPRVSALVHAATQAVAPVAPGQIVTIYGENIGPGTGVEAGLTDSGQLPTSVEGTVVYFNGVAAPLFFVRNDQVNAQVPYELSGLITADVRVSHEGAVSDPLPVSLAASAPGVFTYADGSNRAVALNQDGTLNVAANPEARGRVVVLFATGEGVTSPPSATGTPAPNQIPLPVPELPVAVQIGGVPAAVQFAGTPAGYVGLLQVNVLIPLDAPTGDSVPVVLQVGGSVSPSRTAIAIR